MWCHLCTVDFPDFQSFKVHILENHRKGYNSLCNESSENEESEHENNDSNMPQVNFNITVENRSDTTAANMSQENGYDSDNGTPASAHLNISPKKCSDYNHNVAVENNPGLNALNISPRNDSDHKDKTSNKKRKSSKKLKLSSVLKKHVPKKKKKVVFSKRVSPRRRMSAVSYKEVEDSPDHSQNSFNGDSNHVNSQIISSNSIIDPNHVNVQPISNNNPIFLVNPYVGQGTNDYVIANQVLQPPVYVINTAPNSTTSDTVSSFKFSSTNILKWLTKHKELFKNIQFPLPTSLFNQAKDAHKAIFDQYCTASVSEETSAVLQVYEELDCIIHKHINSVNNTLSIL